MSLAERNAELLSRYTQANTEFMAASLAVSAKYMAMKTPSEDELNRLKKALDQRADLDKEMQALVIEAFQSGLKFPSSS